MTVNEAIQQDFVTYAANLRRLTQTEQQTVLAILHVLQLELVGRLENSNLTPYSAARLRSLLKQINEIIESSYTELSTLISDDMIRLSEITTRNIANSFAKVGITLQSVALSLEQYKALATNSLIEGAPSKKWWEKQSKDLQFKFATEIRKGVVAGESMDDIVRRIIGRSTGKWWQYEWNGKTYRYYERQGGIMNIALRQAQALVRTSVQQVAGDTRMAMLQANSDLLKGVHWVSTLDSRTTFMCAARDGKLYTLDGKPIGHKIPFLGGPPIHWNCRSTVVPVTKSWKELSGSDEFEKWDELVANSTRASMDGQVPASQSFQDWFATKSEDFQRNYLGASRYNMYKQGRITIENLINSDGDPLSLAELERQF